MSHEVYTVFYNQLTEAKCPANTLIIEQLPTQFRKQRAQDKY